MSYVALQPLMSYAAAELSIKVLYQTERVESGPLELANASNLRDSDLNDADPDLNWIRTAAVRACSLNDGSLNRNETALRYTYVMQRPPLSSVINLSLLLHCHTVRTVGTNILYRCYPVTQSHSRCDGCAGS